eukprot:113679_1
MSLLHRFQPKQLHRFVLPTFTTQKRTLFYSQPDSSNSDEGFLRNVFNGNIEWLEHNVTSDYAETTKEMPHPQAVVLSCCDSRAPVQVLGQNVLRNSFAVRNIGNQYSNSCGSTHFGLDVLKTPYAMIMGHTNCAAIRAAATSDYNYHHTIVQEIACLVRVIQYTNALYSSSDAKKKLDSMEDALKFNIYSEINVDFQINSLLEDINLSRRVRNGDLAVIGIMFDIHNIYNKGHGRLHITNINGETDIDWLKGHKLLSSFDNTEKDIFLTRLFNTNQVTKIHC